MPYHLRCSVRGRSALVEGTRSFCSNTNTLRFVPRFRSAVLHPSASHTLQRLRQQQPCSSSLFSRSSSLRSSASSLLGPTRNTAVCPLPFFFFSPLFSEDDADDPSVSLGNHKCAQLVHGGSQCGFNRDGSERCVYGTSPSPSLSPSFPLLSPVPPSITLLTPSIFHRIAACNNGYRLVTTDGTHCRKKPSGNVEPPYDHGHDGHDGGWQPPPCKDKNCGSPHRPDDDEWHHWPGHDGGGNWNGKCSEPPPFCFLSTSFR